MQDQSLEISRLIACPPQVLWRCWTDPALLPKWFGPEGYSCVTREIDLREGGLWRFDMIGPDGKAWVNRHRYTLMDPARRIEFLMDADDDLGEPMRVTVTLVPEAAGTRLTQTVVFPTPEAAAGARSFGAERLGQTTLGKLEALALSL